MAAGVLSPRLELDPVKADAKAYNRATVFFDACTDLRVRQGPLGSDRGRDAMLLLLEVDDHRQRNLDWMKCLMSTERHHEEEA